MAQLGGFIQSLVERNRRIEQTVCVLQSNLHSANVDLNDIQEQLTRFNHTAENAITRQSSTLQKLQDGFIKNELASFQQLLVRADSDRAMVFEQLKKMNARIEQLDSSDHSSATEQSNHADVESIEVEFLWFKYRYVRSGANASARRTHRRRRKTDSREVVWLKVNLPSWFIGQQWALRVAKATSGWQYSLRMYKVLRNDEAVFEYCMRGNTEALKELITQGKVSIYDQNESGLTLLHASLHRAMRPWVLLTQVGCCFCASDQNVRITHQ
jgi:hypothetical protein